MIRRADVNDIDIICYICNSPGLTPQGDSDGHLYSEWFELLLNNKNRDKVLFYVHEDKNGTVDGFILGEPLLCDGVKLWMVGVSPKITGRGVGVRLLKYFENQCMNRGFEWINTEGFVDTIPIDKSTKMGYQTNGKRYCSYFKSLV